MEKEFEALKTIKIKCHPNSNPSPLVDEALEIIEQALTELKQIKESKPNEALENIIQAFEHTLEVSNKARLIFNEKPVSVDWNELSEIKILKQALLKAQEQEKVLEIIKKKCLHTDNLNEVATCLNYNYYKERMSKKYDTKVVKTDWNDKVLLDYLKLLTEEEFDALKRWCEK